MVFRDDASVALCVKGALNLTQATAFKTKGKQSHIDENWKPEAKKRFEKKKLTDEK